MRTAGSSWPSISIWRPAARRPSPPRPRRIPTPWL